MKIFDLALNTSVGLLEKVSGPYIQRELRTPQLFNRGEQTFHIEQEADKVSGFKSTVRSVTFYLFDALKAGLKQNFLGADVDMGFLTLTVSVYLIRFARLTVSYSKYFAANQYSEKRDNMSNFLKDDRSIISLH